jgi:hypothetical protein
MDNGVLLELNTRPGPDACIFRISRLRVTWEIRKNPAIFIVVLKIQMLFGSYIKQINVGNKTKTVKRHLEMM